MEENKSIREIERGAIYENSIKKSNFKAKPKDNDK